MIFDPPLVVTLSDSETTSQSLSGSGHCFTPVTAYYQYLVKTLPQIFNAGQLTMDLTMDVPVFYGCPCFSQRLEDWLGIGDYRDVIFTSLFRRNYNWDTSPFVRDLVLRI